MIDISLSFFDFCMFCSVGGGYVLYGGRVWDVVCVMVGNLGWVGFLVWV